MSMIIIEYPCVALARTTVMDNNKLPTSPLHWSADPTWKLDYSNIARLSPREIARRRAEFDRQKEVAKTVRTGSHPAP